MGHQTDTGTDADSATDTDAEERTSAAPWPTGVDDVAAGLRAAQDEIVEQLSDWVRIPSVASQPERTLDVQRSARWLAGAMRAVGLRTEVLDAGGSPAVYGEWLVDPALPTVLVYSHHDVRHAKPEEWVETAPFSPVLRDGRLYGRGASDAKGQVVAHLWGLRAHLGTRDDGRPAVNLKYLVEGEEELGSTHLADLLDSDHERFACDVVVFSDTLQWKAGNPAVVTSMRGMTGGTLTVTGPARDVHSGAASGPAPNPVHALVRVLAAMHDTDGRITIPGFLDDVDELTEERRQELRDLDFDPDVWVERTETTSITGEVGHTVEERLWARPSIEVLTLLAGDPTGFPRAVIPSQATAELSIRTVPGQHVSAVAAQLRAFVAEQMPDGVTHELEIPEESGQDPYVTPSGPALDALVRAIERGHRTETAGRMGNAGGGPAELMGRVLGAPVLFIGTGLPEDHWHASDESVSVQMLLDGAASIAYLLEELGDALR
ncbi:M20/M25/M40 family metallo-hydrolase [Curtobacterium sp. MCSS17_015]|uniref:M20/M25/M40 family metallo-hydrolase n=1 Tax=Curtobacterium sp. MCSS17_015 TaxID=2175666 RepID=UPI001C65336B|nr:M20/M25/M40 family metallo-hydrolase [Curtobacterium sp. MCSS17_015]WIB27889.1 M20/M25/M40 family metallo-hydrolase [Curtobacterium sp. MCSS17_015]